MQPESIAAPATIPATLKAARNPCVVFIKALPGVPPSGTITFPLDHGLTEKSGRFRADVPDDAPKRNHPASALSPGGPVRQVREEQQHRERRRPDSRDQTLHLS